MRLHLKLSKNKELLPYNYQQFLVGSFHKWIGKNDVHDLLSLYSFSWLTNGKSKNKGLDFPNGSKWFISSAEESLIKCLLKGIMEDPSVCYNMLVQEVIIQETLKFGNQEKFLLASPVLIKRSIGDKEKHYTFEDVECDQLLTDTLRTKLRKAGLKEEGINVAFDKSYVSPKTKLIDYKGIKNKASICPVIITGTPEQIAFAWNVGIGNSTGIGFGALK